MSWEQTGNIKGPKGDAGDAVGATVASVFGRVGAVVAQSGDYDASKVTNAISSVASYADPPWIASLSWAKITNTPAFGNVLSVFGRAGNVVAAQDDYSFAQLSGKPTTRAGYGITDAEAPLTFQDSITRAGNTVTLVGDVPTTAPGSSQFYGINAAGTRGWYTLPASQPLDSDLTAIASLTTTSFGRGFLPLVDPSGARTYLGLGSAALADAASFEPSLSFGMSISQSLEDLHVTLLNDVATPAASFYYGTNAAGQRGWFALPTIGGGTGAVSSVFGRTGAIVAAKNDYSFAFLSATPTTISGYGITDAYTKTEVSAAFAQINHTHTFASITSKPSTLAGYGITDAQPSDAQLNSISNLTFSVGNALRVVRLNAAASDFEFAVIGALPSGGTIGQLVRKKSATDFDTEWKSFASAQGVTAGNPTVTGATSKMFGVGALLTPTFSGKVLVIINTQLSTNGGYYSQCTIRYGTGAAPANGANASGTAIGNVYQTVPNQAADGVSFSAIITGLTVGTQYWFDFSGASNNAAAVCTAILPVATLVEIP